MIPFPQANDSLLVLVDIQEKFIPVIHSYQACVDRCSILLQAAPLLELPVVVTEQYPKGLGHTVDELQQQLPEQTPVIEKSSFSCFGEPLFKKAVEQQQTKNLILIGIESHVCVLQTAVDGVNAGYQVFIPQDCVSSRKPQDKETALAFMNNHGIHIVGLETIIFMLLRDATHPNFRAVSKLVK